MPGKKSPCIPHPVHVRNSTIWFETVLLMQVYTHINVVRNSAIWFETAPGRFLFQKIADRKLVQYANFTRTVFSQPYTGPLFLPQLYLESNGTKLCKNLS